MTPLFTVEAALTQAELQAFRAHQMARLARVAPLPTWIGHIIVAFIVALCGALLMVALGIIDERHGGPVATLFILAYFAGVMAHEAIWARYRRRSGQLVSLVSRLAQKLRTYEVTEVGIDVTGDDASGQWRWTAFTEAERARGLLCFWTGSATGFVIPLRAFADPAEAERAIAFAQAQIARARPR